MRPEQVWQAALGELQLQLTKSTFDTWLRDTTLLSYEDGVFVVGVENAYAKDWLENRLLSTIKRTLTGIAGRATEVRFVVWADPLETAALAEQPEPAPPVERSDSYPASAGVNPAPGGVNQLKLNSKYGFESFIVGPSNRLAHAASLAAAENPARAYNPLFLYGGVGLGKTHLLQAVGNACVAKSLTVLYASAEQFTNDLINSIRSHTTETFREKYRSIDVLLVDDIQFIAGKEATQEEFFHTFNALHGQSKQIVISSDRPPKALVTLEERLRSRFEWGLIADVQPPDYETRAAILRSKAEALRRPVPPEVIELIARRVQSNIRELEGALNRVVAYADVLGQPLNSDTAAQAIADLLPRRHTLNSTYILDTVALFYSVRVDDLIGRDRSREVTLPRQMAMYLVREETDASLPEIGQMLGGRDHTTVMHGCEKISNLIETDDSFRRQFLSIRERLYSDIAVPA
ncbi:MAG TPA: chromosomal replication initiator protein DnaA [Anaerolineales bacterium]|nr:chromosomal replication initiator protein DnaA [Anaerolineales bacterium]